MPSYRLYFLNSADRIEARQVIECQGLAQAIGRAQQALTEFPFAAAVEIRRSKRMLARVARNTGASKPGSGRGAS
jgi:hypothetical protein